MMMHLPGTASGRGPPCQGSIWQRGPLSRWPETRCSSGMPGPADIPLDPHHEPAADRCGRPSALDVRSAAPRTEAREPQTTVDWPLEGLSPDLVGVTRAMLEQLLSLCAAALGSAGASPVAPIPAVLTTAEAADLLRVSPRTVNRMAADGRLVAHRLTGMKSARFLTDDVLACLEEAPAGPSRAAVRRPRVLTPRTRSRSIGRSRGLTHGGGASFEQKLAAARRGDA